MIFSAQALMLLSEVEIAFKIVRSIPISNLLNQALFNLVDHDHISPISYNKV